ncbi:PhzF family phenazine biosynthesis protein [Aliifodinibius sp. S!AR15-10]|uniref:PhzF family phenazine biosynthesis protein n=1 Tax=Aliifodinibius sp. S!AR15-10 TaxID=2950437 RepID=UPI0028565FB3|nr:PhzF family phenazine biosynthesis protein [Aliifodinibius sp. S!AR15-10]MDR8391696.1 PhzF family phenazine biosynthesis protein [Aliifodinibius sp. S!AR15-10]
MDIKQFVVDAFTNEPFSGNPAAVCLLGELLPAETMQQIAAENALPETAFLTRNSDARYNIRWFTPDIEMDLCGHATLATAHVLWHHLDHPQKRIQFSSNSGVLEVSQKDGRYILDFPARKPTPATLPETIKKSLDVQPVEVLKSRDYILIYEDEEQIIQLSPDQKVLDDINLDPGGFAITAPGMECDFVSRFFTPGRQIFEDPVTGSAHCSLVPYWAEMLGKNKLHARQLSDRGGTLYCENQGDRVLIGGKARTYSEGTIFVEVAANA